MQSILADLKRKETAAALLKEMEEIARKIRALIVEMPAKDLLGYIYAQRMISMRVESNTTSSSPAFDNPKETLNETQFLLEYVHAVLASEVTPSEVKFDENKCSELFTLCKSLRNRALIFAMASSAATENTDFGEYTSDLEFHTKSSWVLLRGNRYQVLENEFYNYVLEPHTDALKEVYGIGAAEIANGFQEIANATRTGQADALEAMAKQFKAAVQYSMERGKPLEDVMEEWASENNIETEALGEAADDMLRGGIGNVSRHTDLPSTLLADLAYKQGEDTDFFAEGDFIGTPFRTLPARKKPLIQIDSDYYAIDPCFIRDAGYRALLFNLLQRKPDYKKIFKERQKEISERAFPDILKEQLPGAKIYQEVYYKDPSTRQWSENDTLVLIDDVLFLVEAKAGAAATIASPELDFKRHSQAVQDLILKAYKQCDRFFNYLASAEEIRLYNRINGNYVECGRVRRSDYRVMVPIGLTVESFSPFSTICKELPQIKPLLDKHAFISMSIDDLFVLKRFLPTSGAFSHYMEVRQAVAGIKGAHLFDELDHLGAYILKNRFDQDIAEQKGKGKNSLVVWNDMSDVIDQSFEGEDWEKNPKPTQGFPNEVLRVLAALNSTQTPGWLTAESLIRNYGGEARENFANIFENLSKTLNQHPSRYFTFGGEGQPLFVWIQRSEQSVKWEEVKDKASAAALASKLSEIDSILITIRSDQTIDKSYYFLAHSPSEQKTENSHIFEEAERMSIRTGELKQSTQDDFSVARVRKKVGRNEPCHCGSGKKYKKCHG